MKEFFVGFNFDTLLALISCITGVVALFLGGNAYHNCKKINKSFNDKKKFGDGGTDNSQNAGRDIINNNCDSNAIATITSANFSAALNEAYKAFEIQAQNNLKIVIEAAGKIVREKRLELSGYTKIDWINIYFESAKNAADTYMQDIWARVLAKELEMPGTFGYKTLDVLKNMSKDDFFLFEKMCSVQVEHMIVRGEAYKKYGLEWIECLKLSELGLLSLKDSEWSCEIPANSTRKILLNDFDIAITNPSDVIQRIKSDVYILTYAARELLSIVPYNYSKSFLEDIVKDLKQKNTTVVEYEIQKVLVVNNRVKQE